MWSAFKLKTGSPGKTMYVVFLKADGRVKSLISTDQTCMGLAESYKANAEDYIGWKGFTDLDAGIAFAEQLKSVDKEELDKLFTLAAPMTDWTPAEGVALDVNLARMMSEEDKQAAAGETYDFAQMEDTKPAVSNVMDSAMKAAMLGVEGNPDRVSGLKKGAMSYDMGKCKLDFGKSGTPTGIQVGCDLDVSAVFPHKSGKYGIACVVIKSWKCSNLWHLDAKYINNFYQNFISQVLVKKGLDVPLFMETLIDLPIVAQNDPNNYKRQKKGSWTLNKPQFFVLVPKGGFKLDFYVQDAFKSMGSNFRESTEPSVGKQYADWLASNKTAAYNSATGQNSSRMQSITHEKFVTEMHQKLIATFSKMVANYNVPLDTWMTNGHIKQMLIDRCGYSSWDEISSTPNLDLRNKAFKKYPRQPFPDWDTTSIPDF